MRNSDGRSYAVYMLYLLPILFGVVAVVAGGIAWHRPILGLVTLATVMAGYLATTALLASMIGTSQRAQARSPRLTSHVRLVRGL
jgi:hypothetical protein